jgi:hypothetical protein
MFRILIRIRLASWIRIRIQNADPDPEGEKSAKTESKNVAKRQKIHRKKLTLCMKAYFGQ